MTKVTQLIAVIEDLRNEEEVAQAELKRVQDRIQQETDKLRTELKAGGTTKDPLYDLVLRAGYGIGDPSLQKYRELQARLAGRKDEFVMVRYPVEVRECCGGTFNESDMRHEEHFRVGILAGEELRLGNSIAGTPLITLPVDRYLQGTWPASHSRVVTLEQETPLEPFKGDFLELRAEDDPPRLLEYLQKEHYAFDLCIGDEAFRAELIGVDCVDFIKIAGNALDRLVLEPTEG